MTRKPSHLLALGVVAGACAACTPQPGVPSHTDTTAYGAEQLACVQDSDAAAQADECRAASRARFCARFPSQPDCLDGGR